jgi:hypothetical protein
VNVDGFAMDVFGISLLKPQSYINADNAGKTKLKAELPFKNYIPSITEPGQIQIQKDLKRGKLLTLVKLILNRYK